MGKLTKKFLESLKPGANIEFERDDTLTGFGVKVYPSGRISFIAEGRIRGGRTRRKTIGQFPALSIDEARGQAREFIASMQNGVDPVLKQRQTAMKEAALGKTVGSVFDEFMSAKDHKPKTAQDYRNTFNLIFADWSKRPVREITRNDAEQKFMHTRDNRGLPTAAKAFRIISAVFEFAKEDEIQGERLITENPADVIRAKKYKRTVKPRDRYLSDAEIAKLIRYYQTEKDWPQTPHHGVTDQGINYVILLLCSGLRRSEGLRLEWASVDWSKKHFVVQDTKNTTDHYVPLSGILGEVLRRQKRYLKEIGKADSPWVFPARHGDGHMTEPKSQLKRICDYTGIKFSFHDLRRTFATHAEANGVPYELIQRALNHKQKTVTQHYLITQIETLRPVFDAVADGYIRYYDPDREHQEAIDKLIAEMPRKKAKKVLGKSKRKIAPRDMPVTIITPDAES